MDKHSDFIVGRKYVYKNQRSCCTCVGHKTNGVALLESKTGDLQIVIDVLSWKEYREPLVRYGIYVGDKFSESRATEEEALEEVKHYYSAGRIVRFVEDVNYACQG